MVRFSSLVILFFLFPMYCNAAITISEVAWMGTDTSANDEWIELYNDGPTDVSVDGWTLSDGMNLEINLTGTVGAGFYAVLERTDDTSVLGTAFLIYAGALTNTGATLVLKRADESIEDQVSGGDSWENIGGDNATKETAQYTSSGWITATPTPGVSNILFEETEIVTIEYVAEEIDTSPETTTSSGSSSGTTKDKLGSLDKVLSLELTAPAFAYVHQKIEFSLEVLGLGKTVMNSLKFNWNLGDLTIKKDKNITHTYQYPGKYVVVSEGKYAEYSATVRHEITVLPVVFSITKNSRGDIQINNDSKYEVDISGYSASRDKTIIFPENTILLPNATLTIEKEKLGKAEYVWLFNQEKMIIASILPSNVIAKTDKNDVVNVVQNIEEFAPIVKVSESPLIQNENTDFTFDHLSGSVTSDFVETTEVEDVVSESKKEEGKSNAPISKDKLPYLGLIGILSVGVLAVYVGGTDKKSSE